VIFRNVHKLLVDTASSEFLFCLDFWEEEAAFRELFAPVVAVVEGDLSEQLQVGIGGGGGKDDRRPCSMLKLDGRVLKGTKVAGFWLV
jgi:hypothetical protein